MKLSHSLRQMPPLLSASIVSKAGRFMPGTAAWNSSQSTCPLPSLSICSKRSGAAYAGAAHRVSAARKSNFFIVVSSGFSPDGLMACFHSVTTLLPGRKHGRGRKSWKNRGRGEGNFLKKVSLSPPPYPLLSPFKDFRPYRIPLVSFPGTFKPKEKKDFKCKAPLPKNRQPLT